MNQNLVRRGFSVVLLLLAIALLIAGCTGGDETTTTTTQASVDTTTTTMAVTGDTTAVALDDLSTFQSKDPFKQQAVPPSTTGTTGSGGGGGTTSTTTGSGGTTSTTKPSSVTDPVHSLKVLSIDEINGVPVVTFEVDGVIYEDKREGDVVNSSWGQIEVVSIDPDTQTVVFLHGSETRVLQVGQEFLK